MNEIDITNVAKELAYLIPNISAKLKPFTHQARGLNSSLMTRILVLLRQKELLTMKDIATDIRISKQQLTPLIEKMLHMDFVTRETDETDRRIIRIKITSKGLQVLESFQNDIAKSIESKIQDWDDKDLTALQDSLNTLYRYVDKIL